MFVEHTVDPLIEYKDPNVLKIAYVGFATYGQSLARFYYDCRDDEVYTPSQLAQHCELTTTTDVEYQKFVSIEAGALGSLEYLVNLPVYIVGNQDAHILIASDNSPIEQIRNGYEIGETQQMKSTECMNLMRLI